jgi:hypothetical protein
MEVSHELNISRTKSTKIPEENPFIKGFLIWDIDPGSLTVF